MILWAFMALYQRGVVHRARLANVGGHRTRCGALLRGAWYVGPADRWGPALRPCRRCFTEARPL
jgi:hypothetical protein